MRLVKQVGLWRALTKDWTEKTLPKAAGFRWRSDEKVWETEDPRVAIKLRDHADAETRAALDAEVGRIEASLAPRRILSRAVDAALQVPSPAGLSYLPYQRAGVAFMRGQKDVLLADEMGLGKTIQVIGVMNLALSSAETVKSLVVAPKIALLNWRRELENWLIKPHSIAIWTSRAQPAADIVIVNYDLIEKLSDQLRARQWDFLVYDEAHALKNGDSKRTRAALGGEVKVKVDGVPVTKMLPPIPGASNLEELQGHLRETVMVRRLKSSVLADLPAKIHQVVEVEADSPDLRRAIADERKALAQREKALKAAEGKAEAAKADKAAHAAAISNLRSVKAQTMAQITEMRRRTAMAKVPAVLAHVTSALDSAAEAILVFAHHRAVVEALAEGFRAAGHDPAVVTGETSAADRQRAQDHIQQGVKRVFIGSMMACGVAITLTAASTVVFAEVDWSPGTMVQAEDRAHRIGQKDSVLVQYLVVDGSIDANLMRKASEKGFVIDAALDESGLDEPGLTEAADDGADKSDETIFVTRNETPRVAHEPDSASPGASTISVTDNEKAAESATLRPRGRPRLGAEALTGAERARRYRAARRGDRVTLTVPAELAARLRIVAERVHGGSLEAVLAAALQVMEN